MEIIEDLLLAFRLPVFRRRTRRAVTARPKLYFFDAGVFRSLRSTGPLDRPEEIGGGALEGLVAQHLRAWTSLTGAEHSLSFWRTASGVEVDFVVYCEQGLWAFEVKNTGTVRRSDLRPLRSFRSDYLECVPIFLYRGTDRLRIDDILCLPVDDFLRQLTPDQPPWIPQARRTPSSVIADSACPPSGERHTVTMCSRGSRRSAVRDSPTPLRITCNLLSA